jgi:hypothetical protein
MDLHNRKIDEFIEGKLRQTKLESTSSDFKQFVIKRVKSEYKTYGEEERRDRIAKYIIGVFSAIMVGFTVILGYIAKSDIDSTVKSTGITIEPTVETSNNILQQFLSYIQSFFINLLGMLGLSASPQTVSIVIGLVLAVIFYVVADRVFLKGRLKSIRN